MNVVDQQQLEDWIIVGAQLWDVGARSVTPVIVKKITRTQIVCTMVGNDNAEWRYNVEREPAMGTNSVKVHKRRGSYSDYLAEATHPEVIDYKIRAAAKRALSAVEAAGRDYDGVARSRPRTEVADAALALCDAIENAARAARRAILAEVARSYG